MKRHFFLLLLLSVIVTAHAQYKVRFILKEKTSYQHDSIFITGTFSNWDSTANPKYLMKPSGPGEKSITLDLKAGPIKYKFHRGSWFKVEKQYIGFEVPDREYTVNRDIALSDSVLAWRDQIISDKKHAFAEAKSDTLQVNILVAIASTYAFNPELFKSDSALYYAQKAQQLQQKIIATDKKRSVFSESSTKQIIRLQEIIATLMHSLGNYPKALEIRFENLNQAEQVKDKYFMVAAIRCITYDYLSMKDFQNVLKYGKLMDSILSSLNKSDPRFIVEQWNAYRIIATAFYNLKQIDDALMFAQKMAAQKIPTGQQYYLAYGSLLLADIYSAIGDNTSSFRYYRMTQANALPIYAIIPYANAHAGMARLFQKEGRTDSALIYAKQSLEWYKQFRADIQAWGENSMYYLADIYPLLANLYKDNKQLDSAYKYLHLSVSLKDSLYNTDKIRQFQTLTYNEISRRQQLEQQSREEKQMYENKVRIYGLLTGLALILVVASVLYRNNKQKQKANTLLKSQKEEIESTLAELKTTQKQLIQSEKMASLGELTAGIAHEIQNPLNFVNNFSEVNTELIDEMQLELEKGNLEDAKSISNDIKENEQKINHHGKRADAIVKGMLQHSRISNGAKEPTDINALADEYLRLAYHGLRAKDKSFNATLKTDFDETIGKIEIIPQDMGRVILNLITNAFYAVTDKKKQSGNGYEPTVYITTKKTGDSVMISVNDNGSGIPQKVLDKIFQPFFTTKPTGEGTGLGLSMSYDIVKAHGGELNVETKDGEGSVFTIII
jgi:signal transduction histidine kinase